MHLLVATIQSQENCSCQKQRVLASILHLSHLLTCPFLAFTSSSNLASNRIYSILSSFWTIKCFLVNLHVDSAKVIKLGRSKKDPNPTHRGNFRRPRGRELNGLKNVLNLYRMSEEGDGVLLISSVGGMDPGYELFGNSV